MMICTFCINLRFNYLGYGRISDAVLSKIKHHHDLGIHSELISDALVSLFKSGQVTNARKVPKLSTLKCNKNLAIANRSRVSFAHNTLRVSIGMNITP